MSSRILKFLCVAMCITEIAAGISIFAEDFELRDLDVAGWDCLNRLEGTAKTPDGCERNRMKNRSPVDLSGLPVEPLDTAAFLKKVGEYDSQIAGKRRAELNAAQKQQLESFEKQIVSLTGWLVSAYCGPPETTNCGSTTFHDWHLEIFENAGDHAPRIGDPTPIICEITPRTERVIYRENVRIQVLTQFFRRQDMSFQPTGHRAQKILVTGFLLWDDEHNGAADVGTTIQWFSSNGLHHPWRSTAWEIHPILKVEIADAPSGKTAAAASSPPR